MQYLSENEEFQKKKSFLIRKSAGKSKIDEYQQMLSWLFPNCVIHVEFLELAESDNISELSTVLSEKYAVYKKSTVFSDKVTLKHIVKALLHINDSKVYFFSSYAEYCGLAALPSLTCLDTDFIYDDNFPSMFWFRTPDMENELFINFGEEDGDIFLEIEIAGKVWSSINEIIKE